jgi:hypothetical protein
VHGCLLLIRETRITLHSLREEARFSRQRFQLRRGTSPSPPRDAGGTP